MWKNLFKLLKFFCGLFLIPQHPKELESENWYDCAPNYFLGEKVKKISKKNCEYQDSKIELFSAHEEKNEQENFPLWFIIYVGPKIHVHSPTND